MTSKNPSSSNTIDKNVIEKNKTSIFNGLIESLLVSPLIALSKGIARTRSKKQALIKGTIQNVSIEKFLILILGNLIIQISINIIVIILIQITKDILSPSFKQMIL